MPEMRLLIHFTSFSTGCIVQISVVVMCMMNLTLLAGVVCYICMPGVLQGMKVNGEVDPERVGGQVYPSLVALLKNSSQHFSTSIGKQVCANTLLCNNIHK